MSEGKGGDDLGVFDDLVKGKGWSIPPDAAGGSAAGGVVPPPAFVPPPPPLGAPGGLVAPVGRSTRTGWPAAPVPATTPPPPPGRASYASQPTSMRPMPIAPVRRSSAGPPPPPPLPQARASA